MRRQLCLIFILLLCVPVCLAGNRRIQIGKLRNGSSIITTNITATKHAWEQVLKEQKLSVNLSKWQIISVEDQGNTIRGYLLIATGDDSSVKIATQLIRKHKTLFLDAGPSTTLTVCQGCQNGCAPSLQNGHIVCTTCINLESCSKTSMLIINYK